MKGNQFIRNQEADVLGLPIYLIIVMIIAVAVIAAVIFMIPTGTKTIGVTFRQGAVLEASTAMGTNGTALVTPAQGDIQINVFTMDDQRNPVVGATVTAVGLNTVITFTETENGLYINNGGQTIELQPMVNSAHLKLIISAPAGFERYEDESAITVARVA